MTQDNGSNLLKATNEDTSGPFFPIYFQDESLEDLTVLGPGSVGGPRGELEAQKTNLVRFWGMT